MLIRIYLFLLCFLLTTIIEAKFGRRKGELKQPVEFSDWNGKWFPFDPQKPIYTTTSTTEKPETIQAGLKHELNNWNLKWFPLDPNKPNLTTTTSTTTLKPQMILAHLDHSLGNWNQKWFPFKASNKPISSLKSNCDDGQRSIEIDFDPNDKRHSLNYLCLSNNRSEFEPNLQLEAILEEQFIPPAFVPPIKCLNESISYENPINTFGAYRPLPPKYGSYIFLPPQRWLHSIAEGAIVMLYHPCAFPGQVKLLRDTLQSCLYRHIITPSQALSPQRPLALLAWGKSLQMSVIDDKLVIDFIKSNAKQGPISMRNKISPKSAYETSLLTEAKLITDMEDTEICGYKEM